MNARKLLVCTALFLLVANAAYAGGYQLTKDGKTRVWNNHPDRGDEATWSGERDERGYATGPGTLAWYRAAPKIVTGSNIPSAKGPVHFLSRVSGTMAAGKFEGVVEMVNANGRTYHTVFAEGNSNDDWEIGPAPTPSKKSKARPHEEVAAKTPTESSPPSPEPTVQPTVAAARPTPEPQSSAVGLFKPPSSLRETPAPASSPAPSLQVSASPAPALSPAAPTPAATPAKSEEEAVRDLIFAFAEAWGTHDGHEMDKIVATDVDFITADTTKLHGRADLEKYHARQPAEHYRDTKNAAAEAKIRFPKPEVAQVTWNWSMRGELNADGTVRPRRSGLMTMTAEKRDGIWVIVAARNATLNTPAATEKKP